MIPTAKHLNHYNLAIGEIHCIKLTKAELQRLVLDCPLPILSERGATAYCAPLWEQDFKGMVKSGKIGAEKAWYSMAESPPDDADEV